MSPNHSTKSKNQELFQTMFVGILLYSVVLGFFNDYTDILKTTSYSTTFTMAIVMQLLTYATFATKDVVKKWFAPRSGRWSKLGLVMGVWLVLFLSKFVFLAIIDVIFGQAVYINGFIGLMKIIISLTLLQQITDILYRKLN